MLEELPTQFGRKQRHMFLASFRAHQETSDDLESMYSDARIITYQIMSDPNYSSVQAERWGYLFGHVSGYIESRFKNELGRKIYYKLDALCEVLYSKGVAAVVREEGLGKLQRPEKLLLELLNSQSHTLSWLIAQMPFPENTTRRSLNKLTEKGFVSWIEMGRHVIFRLTNGD